MQNTKQSKFINPFYMDFPIHIDTISMGLPIMYIKGQRQSFLNYDVFLSLKVVLILAKCEDPDEMQHNAAFHLGLHSLPKDPFRGIRIQRVNALCYSSSKHIVCKSLLIFCNKHKGTYRKEN